MKRFCFTFLPIFLPVYAPAPNATALDPKLLWELPLLLLYFLMPPEFDFPPLPELPVPLPPPPPLLRDSISSEELVCDSTKENIKNPTATTVVASAIGLIFILFLNSLLCS